MLDKPGSKSRGNNGGIRGFLGYGEGFSFLEGRLDVLEEGDGERVALVEVRDICVKAGERVLVGEETDVVEFPAEDLRGGGVNLWTLVVKIGST